MLAQLGQAAAASAKRLEDAVAQLEATVEHREMRTIRGLDAPVDPDVSRSVVGRAHAVAELARPDRTERTRGLGDGLGPFLGRVAAPRDAAADVERERARRPLRTSG